MICSNCGLELETNAAVCGKCAASRTKDEQAEAGVSSKRSIPRKPLFFSIICLMVAIVALLDGGHRQVSAAKTVELFLKAKASGDFEKAFAYILPDLRPSKAEMQAMVELTRVLDLQSGMEVVKFKVLDQDIGENEARIRFEVTLKQNGKKETDTGEMHLVKMDGKWYLDEEL